MNKGRDNEQKEDQKELSTKRRKTEVDTNRITNDFNNTMNAPVSQEINEGNV